MNNPSGEICVCGNWNSGPAAIMSFVGLETNTEKPFSWDWDADNPLTIAAHTYPTTTTTTTTPTTFLLDQARHDGGFGGGQFSSTGNLLYPQIPAGLNGSDSDYGGLVKREDGFGGNYQSGRIGLNLGHRTYFSSQENAVINRMFRRSRGFLQPQSQIPRCQAEGCKMDLSNAKHYHRRHKVCEFHSKATRVITGGLEQRFCQQCSRFHVLAEFDEVKRSCRKRLADHNRRRRKPQPGAETAGSKSAETSLENGRQIGKGTRDVTSQVGSVSRPELKTTSPSPSLPLMINSNSKAHQHKQYLQQGPAFLSLGGVETTNSGSNICNQEPFILNRSTQQPLSASSHNLLSSFRDIPLDLSPLMIASSCRVAISHHNLFCSSNQASQSTAGSDQSEQEIQYLRKFGQSIFEAEQI